MNNETALEPVPASNPVVGGGLREDWRGHQALTAPVPVAPPAGGYFSAFAESAPSPRRGRAWGGRE